MLADIKAYLISNNVGTAANIFTADTFNELPDSPDKAIMLFNRGGSPAIHTCDGHGVDFPGLQILIRGAAGTTGIAAAKVTADLVYSTLKIVNTTVGSHFYQQIKPTTGEPVDNGKDGKNRPVFMIDFRVTRSL
jgi:hypothetical protein